ncbi:MAG TPA: hypothetical protein VFT12_10850 [Thermoanaerobaculia bacterium]|nr:hypothetical protein [Thermoanaerobaculia bacterium]
MTLETVPLSDDEMEKLSRLVREAANPSARDLLAFTGVRTTAGLIARLISADPSERSVLLTAIRRAISAAN